MVLSQGQDISAVSAPLQVDFSVSKEIAISPSKGGDMRSSNSNSIQNQYQGTMQSPSIAAFSMEGIQNRSAAPQNPPVIYYKANARKRTLKGYGDVFHRKSRSIPEALAAARIREERRGAPIDKPSDGECVGFHVEDRIPDEKLKSRPRQRKQRPVLAGSAAPARVHPLSLQDDLDEGIGLTAVINEAIRCDIASIKESAPKIDSRSQRGRKHIPRRSIRLKEVQSQNVVNATRDSLVDEGAIENVVALRQTSKQVEDPHSLRQKTLHKPPIFVHDNTNHPLQPSFATTKRTMNTAGSTLASRRRQSRVDPYRRPLSTDSDTLGTPSVINSTQKDGNVSRSRCFQPAEASLVPDKFTSNDKSHLTTSSASNLHSIPKTPDLSTLSTNDQTHTLKHQPSTSQSTAPVEKLPPHKRPPPVKFPQDMNPRPKVDPVMSISMGNQQSEGDDESVQIITDDKKSSCWSRATASTGPSAGNAQWNKHEQLPESSNIARRGDYGKLPRYTFPGSRKREPVSERAVAKTSFDRQLSSLQTSEPSLKQPPRVTNSHAPMTSNNLSTPKSPVPPHLRETKEMSSPATPDSNRESPHNTAKKVISAMKMYTPPPHLKSPGNIQARKLVKDPSPAPPQQPADEGTNLEYEPNGLGEAIVLRPKIAAAQPAENAPPKSENEVQVQTLASRKAQLAARKAELQAQLDAEAAELEAEENMQRQNQQTQFEEAGEIVAENSHIEPSKSDAASIPQPMEVPTLDAQDFGNGLAVSSHGGALKDITNTRHAQKLPSKGPPHRKGHAKGASPKSETTLNKAGKAGKHGWENTHYESQLVNWDGGWQPAPIGDDWTTRDKYDNSKERIAVIETWQQDHAVDPDFQKAAVDVNDQQFMTGQGVQGEDDSLARPIDHLPTKPRTDPLTQTKGSKTAQQAMEEAQVKLSKASNTKDPNEQLTKTQRRELRQALLDHERNFVPPPCPHAPEANIYLRPAEVQDLRQIADIYDYYILNSVHTPLVEPEDGYWRDRLVDSAEAHTPFIVAILMADKAPRNSRDINKMPKTHEHVVGFTSVVDYGTSFNAYKYTVELEMWVRPEFHKKGIGRTMMDRAMGIMCPIYDLKENVPFIAPGPMDYWMGGGRRVTKTVMFSYLSSEAENEQFKWMKCWLMKEGFSHAGIVPDIAFKLGRCIQLHQFFYTTGTEIGPLMMK